MYQFNSFEQHLKKQVDSYRMYPSDELWNSIRNRLPQQHPAVKWSIAIPVLSILLSLSLLLAPDQDTGSKKIAALGEYLALSAAPVQSSGFAIAPAAGNTPAGAGKRLLLSANSQLTAGTPSTFTTIAPSEAVPETTELVPVPVGARLSEPVSYSLPAGNTLPALQPGTITLQPANATMLPEQQQEPADPLAVDALNFTDAERNFEVDIPQVTRRKLQPQIQFYGAPSASYRVLYADNKINLGNIDPESRVSHHSSLGWEGGIAVLLPLSERLTFKTGFQANYTRYTVTASQSFPEVSTVTLTTFARMQRVSTLRNTEGGRLRQLANETFQLSVPVGLEYRLAGNRRFSWNLAGTLQPTYMVAATGYLVTNDYRNYIKAPDLLRRTNLNSALETFVRFNAGRFDIQAGPQLRYQLFSNSKGMYPIQEHLVDYGFKLGIIKTLK